MKRKIRARQRLQYPLLGKIKVGTYASPETIFGIVSWCRITIWEPPCLSCSVLSPWVPPHLLLLLSGSSAVFWRCTASGFSSLSNRRWASVRDTAAIQTSLSFKEGKIKASGTMICPQHWLKNTQSGNCLAVQWWGLHTSTAGDSILPLLGA